MPKVLSPAQINQYERDGILFPIPVLSTDEVLMFRSGFEEMAAHFSGPPKPTRLPHLHFRWAYDLATHPAILDVIEDVSGTDILVFSTMVFYKPPRDLSYISWHQDGLYPRMRTHQLTSAWIALNASTVENGCMRVVPASHQYILPHTEYREKNNLLESGQEVVLDIDEATVKDVVLNPGEMSLHHVNIIHGSNPNRSDTMRIGFIIRFIPPQVKLDFDCPVILARGRDDYHHFELMKAPPSGSIEEGMAAQADFEHQLSRKQ